MHCGVCLVCAFERCALCSVVCVCRCEGYALCSVCVCLPWCVTRCVSTVVCVCVVSGVKSEF